MVFMVIDKMGNKNQSPKEAFRLDTWMTNSQKKHLFWIERQCKTPLVSPKKVRKKMPLVTLDGYPTCIIADIPPQGSFRILIGNRNIGYNFNAPDGYEFQVLGRIVKESSVPPPTPQSPPSNTTKPLQQDKIQTSEPLGKEQPSDKPETIFISL